MKKVKHNGYYFHNFLFFSSLLSFINLSLLPPPLPLQGVDTKPTKRKPEKNAKLLYYPRKEDDQFAILITYGDEQCLDDGEFLNDTIIDFYLKYLEREKVQKKKKTETLNIFMRILTTPLQTTSKRSLNSEDEEKCTTLPLFTFLAPFFSQNYSI